MTQPARVPATRSVFLNTFKSDNANRQLSVWIGGVRWFARGMGAGLDLSAFGRELLRNTYIYQSYLKRIGYSGGYWGKNCIKLGT